MVEYGLNQTLQLVGYLQPLVNLVPGISKGFLGCVCWIADM